MARVAPVNLPYNIKTLWFDPGDLDIHAAEHVVVKTARGLELGVAASDVIEVDDAEIKKLKSPLKPVERIATEEDLERAEEMERLGREAMPVFKEMAREANEDMHPVSVEYLLDGDKAIFYFEAEERIDFRELVRNLASRFHVRIDMRQIGVRDEARIVGGLAHCGQVVCCKRLGGEFNPVSIRMAKDQDLSLNPQKISGLCGRLMCCLRYENEAYKDLKSRAPKVGSEVETPIGKGKVVELDVPREIVSVRVGDEKPVKVPLADFEEPEEGPIPRVIGGDAWERASFEETFNFQNASGIFQMPAFTGNDKLGTAKAVHHESHSREDAAEGGKRSSQPKSGRNRRRSGKKNENRTESSETKRQPRRRSTTIKGGKAETKKADEGSSQGAASVKKEGSQSKGGNLRPGHRSSGLAHEDGKGKKGGSKHTPKKAQKGSPERGQEQPKGNQNGSTQAKEGDSGQRRRRRRRRKSPSAEGSPTQSKPDQGGGE